MEAALERKRDELMLALDDHSSAFDGQAFHIVDASPWPCLSEEDTKG